MSLLVRFKDGEEGMASMLTLDNETKHDTVIAAVDSQ